MNKLCALFGHKVSQVALLICEIKANDLNRGKPNVMKCERCNWTLDLNNREEVDAYAQYMQERNFCRTLWNMITGQNDDREADEPGDDGEGVHE